MLPWIPVAIWGDSFNIVQTNLAGGTITGTFNGLPNNGFLQVGSYIFKINYNPHSVAVTCVSDYSG